MSQMQKCGWTKSFFNGWRKYVKACTGTMEEVKQDIRRCLTEGAPGGGYLLACGDMLPTETSPEKSFLKWFALLIPADTVKNKGGLSMVETSIFSLKDKVALITGAGTGIGRTMAICLASYGAKIGIHYRSSESEARKTLEEIKKSRV